MQILSILQESCGESPLVLPMELGSLESLEVDMGPSPPSCLELHESSGDPSVVLSMELASSEASAVVSTPSVGSGEVLATNSDVLFAKEFYGLLVCLEAASPGYGKDIACVLTGKSSEDVIKKVEKSLSTVTIRGKRRKKGIVRKDLAAAWS